MAEAAEAKAKAKAKAAPKAKAKAKAAPKAEADAEAPAEAPAEEPAPVAAAVVDKSLYKRGDVNKMIGTYQWSINGSSKVFDPLNLASKYDVNWLREAELKHGRVTMLATVGFLANDLGLKFPWLFVGTYGGVGQVKLWRASSRLCLRRFCK